jgi:hypothetical protein
MFRNLLCLHISLLVLSSLVLATGASSNDSMLTLDGREMKQTSDDCPFSDIGEFLYMTTIDVSSGDIDPSCSDEESAEIGRFLDETFDLHVGDVNSVIGPISLETESVICADSSAPPERRLDSEHHNERRMRRFGYTYRGGGSKLLPCV